VLDEKEVEKGITEIFQETFAELKGKDFDLEKKQSDFENWDSFAHMELVGKIEEKFGISLEVDEVIDLDSPKKFVEIVLKKKRE